MIVHLFSIHDATAGIFMSPFVARSSIDALRQIRASRDDPTMKTTPVGQNPSDFALYEVGSFDDEQAAIYACSPARIASVADIWAEKPSGTVSP